MSEATSGGAASDPGGVDPGTVYNGSGSCTECGAGLGPVQMLYTMPTPLCWNCSRHRREKIAKGMMTR